MKIAIQGHPTRGKEIIQILESLGGINDGLHEGNNPDCYYELHGNIIWCVSTKGINFKYYTLEEFEKEFPFKIGDKVTFKDYEYPYTIKSFDICFDGDVVCEFEENGFYYSINKLKHYKEMKEERNITLTLDKAREWYNKGGELREIALQAFTEKELNPLPRSWEEFATSHARMGYYISSDGKPLMCASSGKLSSPHVCPSKESAEAHLAMIQLEQLRDCWRQGWKPDWNDDQQAKHCIVHNQEFKITILYETKWFLSFPTNEMAEEFLECFRDLIEKAGDLI
jgi:hypothetical protein